MAVYWRRRRGSKYNNKKVDIDGNTFDSLKEGSRYSELKLLEKVGEITDLILQPRFLLLQKFEHQYNGKVQKMEYVADFMYYDTKEKRMIVEDVKGVRTKEYLLKKKLFLVNYPEYELREI